MHRQPNSLLEIWLPEIRFSSFPELDKNYRDRFEYLLSRTAPREAFAVDGASGSLPYIETIQFTANIIRYFEALDGRGSYLREACMHFLHGYYRVSSGFADVPGGDPLVFATYFGLTSLALLGGLDETVRQGCASFLAKNCEVTGLPQFRDGDGTSMAICFWATVAASLVGEPVSILGDRIPGFVASCRKPDGTYASNPQDPLSRLQPTVEALIIQRLFGIHPEPTDGLFQFVQSCQRSPETFGERAEAPHSLADSMLGVVATNLLLGRSRRPGHAPVRPPRNYFDSLWKAHTYLIIRLTLEGRVDALHDT